MELEYLTPDVKRVRKHGANIILRFFLFMRTCGFFFSNVFPRTEKFIFVHRVHKMIMILISVNVQYVVLLVFALRTYCFINFNLSIVPGRRIFWSMKNCFGKNFFIISSLRLEDRMNGWIVYKKYRSTMRPRKILNVGTSNFICVSDRKKDYDEQVIKKAYPLEDDKLWDGKRARQKKNCIQSLFYDV